jgi:MYXO-CTERM domain-containing protein
LPAPPTQPVLPTGCGCEPTKEKYCKVVEVACRADSDCPKTFTCRQSYPGTSASGPACIDPGNGNGDAGTCGSAAFAPPPADIYRCIPPYDYVDTGYGKGEGTGYPTTPTTTSGNPSTGGVPPVAQPIPGQPADAGVPVDPGTAAAGGDNPGAAPSHVKACSVSNPGESTGSASTALWTTLMSLAAAWALTRRRR